MRLRATRSSGAWAVLTVALLVLPTLATGVMPAPRPAAAAVPPNIVLIVTDDQDFRSLQEMPNVRKLLTQEGTTFPNFIFSTPGCCPSRASILRGQYTHNHGVLRSKGPNGGFATFYNLGREESTVATWLKHQGYRTALVGKYLNGYPEGVDAGYVPPGWTEWQAPLQEHYFGYDFNDNGTIVRYGHRPEDYLTDVLSQKAQDFVRRSAKAGKPFFLHLTPRAPHGPAIPAPRHAEAFPNATAPRVPSFNEEDVSDKPAYVHDAPPFTDDEIDQIDALYRDRLRTLLAVDEMVADLIATLEATNTLGNTYVFFTTDNGYLVGEHRVAEKGLPYEESIRMPLLVRGPGVRAGAVEDRLVSNIDLAPTFAALAGTRTPRFVDGRSLVPLLRGEPPGSWRQAVLVAAFGRDEEVSVAGQIGTKARVPAFRALRAVDRLYVEYATDERELYDLANDPYQLDNLAAGADPAELDRLSAWLTELKTCARAGCRAAEDEPPGGTDAPAADGRSTDQTEPDPGSAVKPDKRPGGRDRALRRAAARAQRAGGDAPARASSSPTSRRVRFWRLPMSCADPAPRSRRSPATFRLPMTRGG